MPLLRRELFLLGLTWLFAVAGGLSVVAPAVLAAAVTLNLRERRFRSASFVVLLSPFGLAFLLGVRSYWFGAGTSFFRSSQASAHQYGLDPMSRAPIHTGFGCFPSGNEWVVAWPSTVGLHLMAHLFGPMPGSYDGTFPAESDIEEVLRRAPGVETGSGYVVVDGRRIPVDPELLLWADWCFDYP